ncbi:MAG: flagellin [Myxococcales bacterium]|nr:flagellin [Myxococcales bacterium]
MGLFINTNVASLNAQRNLLRSSNDLGRSFERLSSGLRINSARDDAAGLAITTRFTSQVRGLNQAVRNTNDGISLAQTVEGALQESTNILQRIRELSIQSANDINTESDRESLDAEVQQLIEELDRIGETTTFNNQNVLNGDFVKSYFHVGANARETISVSVEDARAKSLGRAAVLTGLNTVTAALADGDVVINGVTIRATAATDDALSTTQVLNSAIAKAQAINDSSAHTNVTARALASVDSGNADIQGGGDLNSADYIQINGQVITGFTVQADDADGELLAQINAVSADTGVIASLDINSRLVLTAEDGRNIDLQVVGNANVLTGLTSEVTLGRLEISSDEQVRIEGADTTKLGLANAIELVGVNSTNAVDTINVLDRENANRAIGIVDRALEQISGNRARLGAIQNRLEATINNLTTISENLSSSRSRILDADFADETARLSRNQILQQAGTSILAQANQQPQQALALLG